MYNFAWQPCCFPLHKKLRYLTIYLSHTILWFYIKNTLASLQSHKLIHLTCNSYGLQEIKNHKVRVASSGITLVPNFVKTGNLPLKLFCWKLKLQTILYSITGNNWQQQSILHKRWLPHILSYYLHMCCMCVVLDLKKEIKRTVYSSDPSLTQRIKILTWENIHIL
jgi:hypothetical protein